MDAAHAETDRRLEAMERKLRGIYMRAKKEISEAWNLYMDDAAGEIEEMQRDYDDAKRSGDRKEIKKTGKALEKKKRERTIMDKRYKDVVERTVQELANVNAIATAYINGQLPPVYALNYNHVAKALDSAVRGYSFNLLNPNVVRLMIKRDEVTLPERKLDVTKDKRWNMRKINAEVTQGIIQGESMPHIAERLTKVQAMNMDSAIRAARTIVTGTETQGRMDMLREAEDMGIIVKKRWIATHDVRTRDWHTELDGQLKNIDEPFVNAAGRIMYPGDPSASAENIYNCRCTIGYEVEGFTSGK